MNTIQGEGGSSTLMKFFLIVTACIIINVVLYLFEDKWIGGLFSGAWLFATVLTYLYNRGFDLNITNYSMTTLLQKYFFPILTYLAWIGVIYWLITAQNDLSENPTQSQVSRNFAGVMTGFIPVLTAVVTQYYSVGKPVGWAILYSILALSLGSYLYYVFYNLLNDCDKNISKSSCWTYGANVTFLFFILITGTFGYLSTIDLGRATFIQFLPRNFLSNPTLPINLFSLFVYLMLWISFLIVFFRHDSKFGDEEGDPVNATFTAIGILMLILLLGKELSIVEKLINAIIYMVKQPLSTILLHLSIIITLIVSIYFTTIYLESNGYNQNGGILTLEIFLWILLLIYLTIIIYSYSKA
jgi:hypothetical protein